MAPSPGEIAIFSPLVIGVGLTTGTIVIHAVALITIVHFVRHERRLGSRGRPILERPSNCNGNRAASARRASDRNNSLGWVFDLCREFPNFAPAFYHSALNYTSLGYGDVVMSSSWRLLGPLETADGMLMFGVSTAMLFAVIKRLIQTRLRDADG